MKTAAERRKQIRECLKARKQRLKEDGMCQDCGALKPRVGRTLCMFCLDARRRSERMRVFLNKRPA